MFNRCCVRQLHTEGSRRFLDRVRIQVIGGRGGKGVLAFEHPSPWKKRSIGGNGGRGGDIVIEASQTIQDLHFSSFVIRGRPGSDATRNGSMGRCGRTKRIMVPVGTLVKEVRKTFTLEAPKEDWGGEEDGIDDSVAKVPGRIDDSITERIFEVRLDEPVDKLRRLRGAAENGEGLKAPHDPRPAQSLVRTSRSGLNYREEPLLLADLDKPGSKVLVARGGTPGFGNKGSLLTFSEQMSDNLKPHVGGSRGENRLLELELKSIADVGLVGFPNAGKSSLLATVSKARPLVADYPFTTLHPHVGVMQFRDGFSATMADIPGLIEGAHADAGMGHEFLRHVERTKVLLYVVDASAKDPVGDLESLREELRLFKATLPARPSLVVANKQDLGYRSELGASALKASSPMPVFSVSTVSGVGIPQLMQAIRWFLEKSVLK